VSDKEEAQRILDKFASHGYNELDVARTYGGGTAEQFLVQLDLKGFVVDTKIPPKPSHRREDVRKNFQTSLDIFKPHGVKIRTLYLHWPDRSVPFEETVEEINKLHKEGLFENFGLSNYRSWEVTEIYTFCKERGYVLPTVYTGNYNILVRGVEEELMPCLRKFGIRFTAWNPLAGGFLAGKFLSPESLANAEAGGRFDPSNALSRFWIPAYDKDANYKAVQILKEAADKAGIPLVDVAHRWLQHHSALVPSDAVILGASNIRQLESNMAAAEGGPLPEPVLAAIDEVWKIVALSAKKYWF